MATGPLIQLRDLGFAYEQSGPTPFSLRVGALSVERGEAVACIGGSGSGKTTLLHLIAGVLEADTGRVETLGHDLSRLSDRQRRDLRLNRIGMVFQEFELLEYVSAADNLTLSARVGSRHDLRAMRENALRLASAAGIGQILARKPRRLSQGERQRVAICRALAPEPELILCDEPTGNLDPVSTDRALDLLLERARSGAAAVLVATHNHGLLDRFDRVVDMATLSGAGPGTDGGPS